MKALKVVTMVYALALISVGLVGIVVPEQLMSLFGLDLPDSARVTSLLLCAIYVAAGVWSLVAAQDLSDNLNWVKLLVTKASFSVVGSIYLALRDYVDLTTTGVILTLVVDVAFVSLVLIWYPWRSRRRVAAAERS